MAFVALSTTAPASAADAAQSASTGTEAASCRTFNQTKWGRLAYSSANNATVCSNGSRVWTTRNPDCSVTALPPVTLQSITWCGVYNSGGTFLEVGLNYNLSSVLGGNASCYTRFRVNSYSSLTSTYGSC
jgi:hypothetical protein